MKKTFFVHASHHREISPGKGSIIWLLSDEKGRPRKVNAITDIDPQGLISPIQAVYKREIPLVERLHYTAKGETFELDFNPYNQEQNYQPREVYDNLRRQEQVAHFSGHVTRMLWILGGVVLCWFVFSALIHVSHWLPKTAL